MIVTKITLILTLICVHSFCFSAVDPLVAGVVQPWELRQQVKVAEFYVNPKGLDSNQGTKSKPFKTLTRAMKAVRSANKTSPVDIMLSGGNYTLNKPLHFGSKDGGQNGKPVRWMAVDGEKPVISGGLSIEQWKLFSKEKNIYVANTPKGLNARQIWINDQLVAPASIEIPRDAVAFDNTGFTLTDSKFQYLTKIDGLENLELEALGAFTNRISPVKKVKNGKFVMEQPAWKNNNWGYDTIHAPLVLGGEKGQVFISNALAFVDDPGEWFLDAEKGRLYMIPPENTSVDDISIIMPRLPYLISISGTPKSPVRDLLFSGIRFSYTSWLGPSSAEGYANQQTGAYITGNATDYPEDAFINCAWGCREFEKTRNKWLQMPAAIQVSAAERINFEKNVFAHLGQVALGIGNDAIGNASKVGLAAQGIIIRKNIFTDLAGGAILVGGIRPDAHHPKDSSLVNSHITIQNNRISHVSKQYRENAAILATYVNEVLIIHNEISDAPYDAISIGWGWGLNDYGGSPGYRFSMGGDIGAFDGITRGHYDHPENKIFYTPTTLRNTIIAYNKIHNVKQVFTDGGAIYTLSSNPDTFIHNNYIYNVPNRIAVYLDEGTKGVTVHNNVVDGAGRWLNVNTNSMQAPLRMTYNNSAYKNWHNSGDAYGWSEEGDNKLYDDVHVKGDKWPEAAKNVMQNSGIEDSVDLHKYEP
jgi:hypothetical protein